MSATVVNFELDQMLRNNMAQVPDPGASGTIHFENKGFAICEVVTAGAEGRTVEAATNYRPGHVIMVVLKTAGGALTVTGAASGTEVLSAAGDYLILRCTDANGTREWRLEALGQLDAAEDAAAALAARVTVTEADIALLNRVSSLTAKADTAAISAAELLTRWINGTPVSAATYTLPTAALLVAAIPGVAVGDILTFWVNNLGADADKITLAPEGSNGSDGILTVDQNEIRQFVVRFTNVTAASEAYVLYGVGRVGA